MEEIGEAGGNLGLRPPEILLCVVELHTSLFSDELPLDLIPRLCAIGTQATTVP